MLQWEREDLPSLHYCLDFNIKHLINNTMCLMLFKLYNQTIFWLSISAASPTPVILRVGRFGIFSYAQNATVCLLTKWQEHIKSVVVCFLGPTKVMLLTFKASIFQWQPLLMWFIPEVRLGERRRIFPGVHVIIYFLSYYLFILGCRVGWKREQLAQACPESFMVKQRFLTWDLSTVAYKLFDDSQCQINYIIACILI